MKRNLLNTIKAILFTLLVMPFYMNLAYACPSEKAETNGNKDIVLDGNGNKVRSSSGDCVRSQWDVGMDRCVEVEEQAPEVKVVRKVIGMEERTVYFDFDSSKLKDEEKQKLDTLARTLIEHKVKSIKILGFTDRIGTDAYNYKLSHRRAEAVRNYLDSKVKLNASILIERALGKQHQVKSCEGVHGRDAIINCLAPNRRVVVEIDYLDKYKY